LASFKTLILSYKWKILQPFYKNWKRETVWDEDINGKKPLYVKYGEVVFAIDGQAKTKYLQEYWTFKTERI
jgi:hypothetical protein